MIAHIARTLGQLMEIDYNEESADIVEFIWMKLNWNIDYPLRFQRNFQFTQGVNTLLRTRYKRL